MNYLKQVAQVFGAAWNGRKYSIKSATALRAFIRVAPDVVRRLDQEHADRTDFRAIGRVIAPWGRRIGDLRFETEGAWKRRGTTVDRWRRSCGWRCSIRKGRRSDGRVQAAGVHQQEKGHRHYDDAPSVVAGDPAPQQLTAPCRKYSGRLHPP